MSTFFVVVATVHLAMVGQPVSDAGEKIDNRMHFQTMDACNEFLGSDLFAAHRNILAQLVSAKHVADEQPPQIIIDAECEQRDSG